MTTTDDMDEKSVKSKQYEEETEQKRTTLTLDDYEWNEETKSYIPKMDDNFLTNYLLNYGGNEKEEDSKVRYDKEIGHYVYEDEETKQLFYFDEKKNDWLPHGDKTKLYEKYRYVDEKTGKYFVFDIEKKEWVDLSTTTEYLDPVTKQRYELNVFENKWEEVNEDEYQKKLRMKRNYQMKEEKKNEKKRQAEEKNQWIEQNEENIRHVYVKGLTKEIDEEEFIKLMEKYGIIDVDIETNKKKVKLYKEKGSNELKGDALCCYVRKESVQLCIDMLNDVDYNGKGNNLIVEVAKFEMKGEKYEAPKKSKKRKQMIKKKMEKNEKLLDWIDRPEIKRQKQERVVVMENAFDKILIMKKLVKEEEKLKSLLLKEARDVGECQRVEFHLKDEKSIGLIYFKTIDMADMFVSLYDKKIWKGRSINCHNLDITKESYKDTKCDDDDDKRLDDFLESIEEEDDDDDDDDDDFDDIIDEK